MGVDPIWDAELLYAFPSQGDSCWFVASEEPDEQSRLCSPGSARTTQFYIDKTDGYYERFMVKFGEVFVGKGQIRPLPDSDESSQATYEGKRMQSTPEVMIIFGREDTVLLNDLKKQLQTLNVSVWDRNMIVPGANRKQTIETHFETASIFLLLMSAHLIASRDDYDLAIRALNRKDVPTFIIPILLTAVDWESTPFGELDPLPSNGKPIGSWKNRDEAYLDVVKGLRKLIESPPQEYAPPQQKHGESSPQEYAPPWQIEGTPGHPTTQPIPPQLQDPRQITPVSDQLVYDLKDQSWYASGFPSTTIINQAQINALKPKIDVVIITATDVELKAVMRLLRPYPRRKSVWQAFIGPETYYSGRFGAYNAVVTKCRMGSIEAGSVTLAANQAQQEWQPRAIIMVGIAFGKDPTKQHIADVLVASQIIPYEQMRVGEKIIFRGAIPPSNPTLLNRFENAQSWTFLRPDDKPCTLHIGPLLSGEKLIDDLHFKRQLFQQFPQAIGGEMEGAGLCAVSVRLGSAWILVKSICDWADGTKHKQHQPLAAAAAVSLVHHVLSIETTLDAIEKR